MVQQSADSEVRRLAFESLEPPVAVEVLLEHVFGAGAPDGSLVDVEQLRRLARELDHNPHALALAGLRLKAFTVSDLIDRLDTRLEWLDHPERVSMREVFSAVWSSFEPAEKDLLHQCTAFRGTFSLAALEAIVELEAHAPWVLDVAAGLMERGALQSESSADEGRRLALPSNLKAWLDETCEDSIEAMRRHAVYYVDLFESSPVDALPDADFERRCEDVDNLEVVVQRYAEHDPEIACRAALSAEPIVRHVFDRDRHQQLLDGGLEAASLHEDSVAQAGLLTARGWLRLSVGALEPAIEDARAAVALSGQESTGVLKAVRHYRVESLVIWAEADRKTGRVEDAHPRLEYALEQCGQEQQLTRLVEAHLAGCLVDLGELAQARDWVMHVTPAVAQPRVDLEYASLKRLAYVHYYLGNFAHQRRLNTGALRQAERYGDRSRQARAKQGLGDVAFAQRDYATAIAHYQAALEVHRALKNTHLAAVLLGNLGGAEHRLGRLEAAAEYYVESLELHQISGAKPYEAVVTFALAAADHERGHAEDARFRYDQAIEMFGNLKNSEDQVATQVCRAWLEVQEGRLDEAEHHLDWAELVASGDWQEIIRLSRGLVEVVQGFEFAFESEGSSEGLTGLLIDSMRILLKSNLRQTGHEVELSQSLQGRLLLQFSPDMIGETTTALETNRLVVGSEGRWFRLGSAEVDLSRRRAHRLILANLVTKHREGEALDVHDAFEIGWPGELADVEAAAERVYWAIGSLRKLGLDEVLLTSDSGYHLDPGLEIVLDQNT